MTEILTQSQIKTYLECKAKFYNDCVLGLSLWVPAFEQGTDYHAAVEAYHLHGTTDERIQPYMDAVAQKDYLSIERPFKMRLAHPESGELLPVYLAGRIDRIAADGVHDFKTSSVSWSQARADKDIQATIYLYAMWQSTGELQPFHFDILRKDRRANGEAYPCKAVTTLRDTWHFKSLWLLVQKIVRDMDNETDWSCACPGRIHELEYIR